jgi:excisionase family DNA binding protein
MRPTDEFITIKELADWVQKSERTIRNQRSAGTLGLRAYKIGGHVRFKRTDAEAWVESAAEETGAPAA